MTGISNVTIEEFIEEEDVNFKKILLVFFRLIGQLHF